MKKVKLKHRVSDTKTWKREVKYIKRTTEDGLQKALFIYAYIRDTLDDVYENSESINKVLYYLKHTFINLQNVIVFLNKLNSVNLNIGSILNVRKYLFKVNSLHEVRNL